METITGYIDHIIFQNKENAYMVLSLITKDREELVCVGTLPGVGEGQTLRLTGDYVEHQSYGRQFKVQSFEETMPDNVDDMERYLSSGAIKGIGETMARRIIKKFGPDTFRIIEDEPERLAEIKGISLRIAQNIAMQFEEKSRMRDVFIFLKQYNISNNLAVKIYEEYGDRVYSILKENPYRLAEDISGVGFRTADEIAFKMGMNPSSEYRIRCGILYVLSQAAADGNTYLPREILYEKSSELLGTDIKDMDSLLANMAVEKSVIIKNDRIYSQHYYYAELACASLLANIDVMMDEEEFERELPRIERVIDSVVKEQNITLDELQKKAVYECIRYGVTIISGGPGTGKTTTINTIIRFFDHDGMDILLAAPTGRAAKRMQEATGYEAKTIHRLLEMSGGATDDDRRVMFDRNEDNPLEADAVIIDEMSMVDINLFRSLLKAVSVGTRLIMVGDVDQLPSVGPGQVLRDVIESGAFHVVRLEHIFRQEEESDIVVNAHRINHGESIRLDNKSRDFFFLERNDSNVIMKHTVQLIKDKLPSYVDALPMDIQVLTPMRKGLLGVENLNAVLQDFLNPKDPAKTEYQVGERLFREGDKVMQIKNNYQLPWEVYGFNHIKIDEGLGVFNGDTGVIEFINRTGGFLTVRYDENRRVDYPFSGLDELELAYAVTIHKSQGSEYPAVIIPLLAGPRLLYTRNLLYTAVTRAKKCVIILGSSEVLGEMIANSRSNSRYSSLADRIKEVVHIEVD